MVRDDNLLSENHEVPQRYIHIHLRHLETQIGISKMPISDDLTFQGGASSRSKRSVWVLRNCWLSVPGYGLFLVELCWFCPRREEWLEFPRFLEIQYIKNHKNWTRQVAYGLLWPRVTVFFSWSSKNCGTLVEIPWILWKNTGLFVLGGLHLWQCPKCHTTALDSSGRDVTIGCAGMTHYPLVNFHKTMDRSTIFNG